MGVKMRVRRLFLSYSSLKGFGCFARVHAGCPKPPDTVQKIRKIRKIGKIGKIGK